MAGLLYKDFVSIGGKKLVALLSGLTVLFTVLRIAFPGTTDASFFLVENEDGELINILDTFFILGFGVFLIFLCSLLNGWVKKLVEGDEKTKIRGYLQALPLGRQTYIASKYVFLFASAYVFLSIAMCWNIIANAFCRKGVLSDALTMLNALVPSVIYVMLLSAALELPLFLTIGRARAMYIKTAIWLVIAFVLIGFLFFGDLEWISQHVNVFAFVRWYQNHQFAIALVNILFPVITLLLYALSYRITCHFMERAE